MNRNQLYDIENKMYRELDAIKNEQKQYNSGVEKGIDMTITAAMKIFVDEQADCIYCNFGSIDEGEDFPGLDDFKLIRGKDDNGKYDYSIAADQNNVFRTCKIRFCPMCGRLLDTEEDKNV